MAEVWRGEHRDTGHPVAIKLITEADEGGETRRRSLRREVQAEAALSHPNIVTVFDFGHTDEQTADGTDGHIPSRTPYIAMELAEIGSLADGFEINSWARLRTTLFELLDALAYAHARDVIHRDLKPGNVLVQRSTDAQADSAAVTFKLTDFGIAHALTPARDTSRIFAASAGTPYYMAPEQFEEQWRDFGAWTDLYALGCVAFELVDGRPPFLRERPVDIAYAHVEEDPPRLAPSFEVPEGLEAWIRRLLRKSPEARFRRAADAAAVLAQLPEPDAIGSPVEERRPPSSGGSSLGDESTLPDAPPLGDSEVLDDSAESTDLDALGQWRQKQDTESDGDVDRTLSELPATGRLTSVGTHQSLGTDTFAANRFKPPPPIPDTWRFQLPEPPDDQLAGAGLGLYGLRDLPFVGRDAPRDRLWERMREVFREKSARVVFLRGETGVGKSRLARWILRRAHEVGAVNAMHAVHGPREEASAGLRHMLETYFGVWHLEHRRTFDRIRRRLRYIAKEYPGIEEAETATTARVLTQFIQQDDREEIADGSDRSAPLEETEWGPIVEMWRRVGRSRPVAVWLDDVHWAPATLELLDRVLEETPHLPLLVVGTVDDEALNPDSPAADQLDRLRGHSAVSTLTLERLSDDVQRQLIERILPLTNRLIETLVTQTGGHPLFAIQLVGDWVDRGVLTSTADGFDLLEQERDRPLPSDIYALWARRIDALLAQVIPDDRSSAREALHVAAQMGRDVDTEVWHRACAERGLDAPEELVDTMVDRGLAERTDHGWAFRHELLRESLQRAGERSP
jgi:serine/threonine protein kinase